MLNKLKNIKLSRTVRRMAQISLCMGLAVLTLSSVTFKQQAVVDQVLIKLENGKGEHLIDPGYLRRVLVDAFGSDLRGIPVEFVDIQSIEEMYNQNPYVRKAEVCMDKNRNMEIIIEERQPIMRVLGNGSNFYLDTEAVEVPLAPNYAARLPIIHLPDLGREWLTDKRKQDLAYLISTFQQDDFMQALVDQVEISKSGEYEIIPLLGNEKIKIGSSKQLDDKISRLQLFYKKKMAKGLWDECSFIDVRFTGQIICDKNKT